MERYHSPRIAEAAKLDELSLPGEPQLALDDLAGLAPSAGVARIERRKRAREGLTDGEAARRYHECTGNGARSSSPGVPAACYFPRDLFFCFFTFRLSIGAFASVPRETGLGTRCFFDFPAMPILLDRGRVATSDPTLQAVGGCAGRASRQTLASPERGVAWVDWPCGQNSGRNPEGRQRASSARDDGASANRVHVAGPALLPEDLRGCWNSPSPTERKRQPRRIVRSARRGGGANECAQPNATFARAGLRSQRPARAARSCAGASSSSYSDARRRAIAGQP